MKRVKRFYKVSALKLFPGKRKHGIPKHDVFRRVFIRETFENSGVTLAEGMKLA
jgi:hypothetical protein